MMNRMFFHVASLMLLLFVGIPADSCSFQGDYYAFPRKYYVDGPYFQMEGSPVEFFYEGMMFNPSTRDGNEVELTVPFMYDSDDERLDGAMGGFYSGVLEVPARVYGPSRESEKVEKEYEVTRIIGLHRNGVTRLSLPDNIREIKGTIWECPMLEELNVSDEMTFIWGIMDCPRLTKFRLPEKLQAVGPNSISETGVEELFFPPMLQYVDRGSFRRNYRLKRLSLGNLVESGDNCFCNLQMLEEIELPETLQRLGNNNFNYLWSLRKVELPSHPVEMTDAFFWCPQLATVTVTAGEPYECPDFVKDYSERLLLLVPDGTLDRYKSADGWKSVKEIREGGFQAVNGVTDIREKVWTARGGNGYLKIENSAGMDFSVYSVSGEKVAVLSDCKEHTLPLPAGIYLVRGGNQIEKILVK